MAARLGKKRPAGPTTSNPAGLLLLEDGSGGILLEDGSGRLLLEG